MATLLSEYFSVVLTLDAYLSTILQANATRPWSLHDKQDTTEYTELLKTSYVGTNTKPQTLEMKNMRVYSPITDMQDVVQQAQVLLFKAKKENILTSGYRLNERGVPVAIHTNSIVLGLKSRAWATLLIRFGVDVTLHLLTDTSIFISLPNSCLCQMTGKLLVHYRIMAQRVDSTVSAVATAQKRPITVEFEVEVQSEKPTKLTRYNSSMRADSNRYHFKKTIYKSPVEVDLARSRLFYGRPSMIPNTQEIICGLQPKHILNQFIPCYPTSSRSPALDFDIREQLEHARRLSKYVFPRQYKLPSAFKFEAFTRSSVMLPNFSDRESMIKESDFALGKAKTPKRLKEVLGLLEKIIWRHGKCKYHILRDKSCPTKIQNKASINKDVILEMLSGETSQLKTQASIPHTSSSVTPIGLTQAREQTKHLLRIVDYACPYAEVYHYIVLVTETVLPCDLWGSEYNFKVIKRSLKEYVTARRFETLSLHQILQGFHTLDCDWLAPPGDGLKQFRINVSDIDKRRELLEDFLFWYFDSFVMTLLKTAFYVTETSCFRNRVLYFRQDDWKWLCAPLIDKLTKATFEKIVSAEANIILEQRSLGFSFVRLLPKDSGVRPIVNLRRKSQRQINGSFASERSINQILQAAFEILTYERRSNPALLGASVSGQQEVYIKLSQFKRRILSSNENKMPKLYFVKVDVQACFDTIEQSKLLEILKEVICHDSYDILQYGKISSARGKITRKYEKSAVPEDEREEFFDFATQMAASLHHIIFMDQVKCPKVKRQDTIDLLNTHISDNIVKIGQDYYRQMIGIPQGSVLSSILCSFFYGDMEKSFRMYIDDPKSVLLRWTDDYMFVTCDIGKARSFLDMMNQGHPEYGCFISQNKTCTNFDFNDEVMNVVEGNQFLWCGFSIDMRDLSVSCDYSRYEGCHLRDTLTVAKGRRPGVVFTSKMLSLVRLRSHPIYSDAALNSEGTIYWNIYYSFLITAMKMHGYLQEWDFGVQRHGQLIQGTIKQVIAYCFASLRSHKYNITARDNGYKSSICKADVFYLGNHAFEAVFSRKARLYAPVIHSLRQELRKLGNHRRKQRFRRMTQDGIAKIVGQIPF